MDLLFWFLPLLLVTAIPPPADATVPIPPGILPPLGIPDLLSAGGLGAVKLAVGAMLLNILGYPGIGDQQRFSANPLESLQRFPFFASNLPTYHNFPEAYKAPGLTITPKSREFSSFSKRRGPNIPKTFNIREASPSEIENFFGVLDTLDSTKCISRLVCEIGAEPKVLEGLGHNVKDVISSLRILEKNKLSMKYKRILTSGQRLGIDSCLPAFPECEARSYRLVKTFVRAFRVKPSSK